MAALCGEPEPAANGTAGPEDTGSGESISSLVAGISATMRELGFPGPDREAEPAEDAGFACALYSDGRFHIETSEGESIGESAAVAEDPKPAQPAQ